MSQNGQTILGHALKVKYLNLQNLEEEVLRGFFCFFCFVLSLAIDLVLVF